MDSETQIILLAITLTAALIALWARFKPVWDAGSAVRPEHEEEGEPEGRSFPKASVIVFTSTEEAETSAYLEMAMAQDYPDYEVILVNEGAAKTTAELAERLTAIYPERLYVTFIPNEARSLSRRKLAYTVGIKAAKGDVVVTTASNCRIPSSHWLSDIMRPFTEDDATCVSLGYSHVDFNEMHGAGKWFRQMDATLTACQWIGAAQAGHPYRGDSNNLAFRRQLFFDQKGYSKTMHLMNGDDDIFISQFMDGGNTRVAISSDSILTSEWDSSANRILAELKERYRFTSQFLPKMPFLRAGLASAMQWVSLAAASAAVATGMTMNPFLSFDYIFFPAIALFILLAFWVTEIQIYRRTARKLESVCLWWSLPWFLLWLPVNNLLFSIRHFKLRRKNYTFA